MSREAALHLQSTSRVLAAAAPENRLKAFRLMASEATRLIAAGHARKPDMVDALHAIARHARLGDDDLITAEIAEAVIHPFQPHPPLSSPVYGGAGPGEAWWRGRSSWTDDAGPVLPPPPLRRGGKGVPDRPRTGRWETPLIWHSATERPARIGSSEVPPGLRSALATVRASDILPQPIHWLWPSRIALGKQTIIAGEMGLGKSQIALSIAAAVTTGADWPLGEGYAPKGSVIVLCAEDDAADTIRPRLDAAGADATRVHIITAVKRDAGPRGFDLQTDLVLLATLMENLGDVRLVVIDPISSYLGRVDSHKNAEVRAVLEPVNAVAARHKVAFLSVTHLNKAGGGSANHRIIGSVAFVAVARGSYIVCPDPDDRTRGLFIPSKNNLGPPRNGLAFRVEGVDLGNGIGASRIVWEPQAVTISANEALAAPGSAFQAKREAPARETGEEFLRALLADGPVLGSRVHAEAKAAGLAMRTLYRAKDQLGVRLAKQGLDGGWAWSLPPRDDA